MSLKIGESPRISVRDRVMSQAGTILHLAGENKAKRVYLVGSCARGEEKDGDDIDFLVEFRMETTLLDLVGLQLALQDLLNRRVDVISTGSSDGDFVEVPKKEMIEITPKSTTTMER